MASGLNGSARILSWALLCAILLSKDANGWGGVSHWYITGLSGETQGLEAYANLPDLWPSNFTTSWPCREVSAEFCWSHIQLKMDRIADCCPIEPSTGKQDPAADMLCLYSKLNPDRRDLEMIRTAKGFAVHNAEDMEVHFSYFPGGREVDGVVECGLRWQEHAEKEEWADYIHYAELIDYPQAPWTNTWTLNNTWVAGDSGIICLAQKVFRKNQQSILDSSHPNYVEGQPGVVESATAISGRIVDLRAELRQRAFDRETYLLARFKYDLNELHDRTWNAVDAASAALSGLSTGCTSQPE